MDQPALHPNWLVSWAVEFRERTFWAELWDLFFWFKLKGHLLCSAETWWCCWSVWWDWAWPTRRRNCSRLSLTDSRRDWLNINRTLTAAGWILGTVLAALRCPTLSLYHRSLVGWCKCKFEASHLSGYGSKLSEKLDLLFACGTTACRVSGKTRADNISGDFTQADPKRGKDASSMSCKCLNLSEKFTFINSD